MHVSLFLIISHIEGGTHTETGGVPIPKHDQTFICNYKNKSNQYYKW